MAANDKIGAAHKTIVTSDRSVKVYKNFYKDRNIGRA